MTATTQPPEDHLRSWLGGRKEFNIKALEEAASLPFTTISQFLRGRSLPDRHWSSLMRVLVKYGYTFFMTAIDLSLSVPKSLPVPNGAEKIVVGHMMCLSEEINNCVLDVDGRKTKYRVGNYPRKEVLTIDGIPYVTNLITGFSGAQIKISAITKTEVRNSEDCKLRLEYMFL